MNPSNIAMIQEEVEKIALAVGHYYETLLRQNISPELVSQMTLQMSALWWQHVFTMNKAHHNKASE